MAVLLLGPLFLPSAPQVQPRTLFADEFDGTSLDRAKWNVMVTGCTVNNEQQAYIDSPDVLTVTCRGGCGFSCAWRPGL